MKFKTFSVNIQRIKRARVNARNFLEEHSIKATTFRIKLVEILQNAKTPLSYDEILESLNANKTTFYRSIEIFEKKGLVIKTENNHKSYYELANEAKAYFICDVCHKVTNIDMPHLNVAKNIKSAVIKGVCDECDHE